METSPARARAAKPAEPLSDREAVRRARAGDRDAFGVLVERHQARVYRLAVRVLRDEELARDAVQEAFLKAYTGLRRFEGRSSFYTWLYRLAMNLCLDFRRRDRSTLRVDLPEVAQSLEIGSGARTLAGDDAAGRAQDEGPVRSLERAELRGAVARAIEALPHAARETLVLREVEGLSYAEIAQALAIPKGTVMSRLHYARKRVQEALREAGVVDAALPHGERSRGARGRQGGER